METDAVLQTLLVDWDDLSTPDYNPLHYAIKLNDPDSKSAVKFRNFYHQLDHEITTIIQNKHKGFNDTIELYNNILSQYDRLYDSIFNLENDLKSIEEVLEIDTAVLEDEEQQINEKKRIYQELLHLQKINNHFNKFDDKMSENDFEYCADTVIEILNCEMTDEIGGLKDLQHGTFKKRKKLLNKMYQKMYLNIFGNIGGVLEDEEMFEENDQEMDKSYENNNQILSFVVKLNGLLELDEYLADNLKIGFFQKASRIIENTRSVNKIFTQSIHLALKVLKKVSKLRGLLNLKDEENFYGKKFTKFQIFNENGDENVQEILIDEIYRIISVYTVNEDNLKMEFDSDKLVDVVDHENLYENKYCKIFDRSSKSAGIYGDYKLIKVPNIKYVFIFDEIIKEEIKKLKGAENRNENKEIEQSNSEVLKSEHLGEPNPLKNKMEISFLEKIKNFIDSQTAAQLNTTNLKDTVLSIITKKNRFDLTSQSTSLVIFTDFLNAIKPYKKRAVFMEHFEWSFNQFFNVLLDEHKKFFRSEIVQGTVSQLKNLISSKKDFSEKNLGNKQNKNRDSLANETVKEFRRQITVNMIHLSDIQVEPKLKTLMVTEMFRCHDFLCKLKHPDAHDLLYKSICLIDIYKISIYLETYLLIIHFLEKLMRNTATDLKEIIERIYEIKGSWVEIENTKSSKENFYLSGVDLQKKSNSSLSNEAKQNISAVLSHFILNNTQKLSVTSHEKLSEFVFALSAIEEFLISFDTSFEGGFDLAFEFLGKVQDGKSTENRGKDLQRRINSN